MALGGVLGNGMKIGYATSSPITWTGLGQVVNVEIPMLEDDIVDSTVHGTSKFKTHFGGLSEVSEATVTLLADLDEVTSPGQHAMFGFNANGTQLYWRVEIPVDRARTRFTAFEFPATVRSYKPAAPIEDRQTLEVGLLFDSAPVTGARFFNKLPAGASQIA